MREIKFRGIRKDTGVWIFGNLLIPNMVLRGEYICDSIGYIDFYPSFEEGDDIKKWDGTGIAVGQFHEILPETKGQFTGLLDKNGKEIYEGDIVEVENGKHPVLTECIYEPGLFTLKDVADGHWTRQLLHQPERLKVIGNIYENSELI